MEYFDEEGGSYFYFQISVAKMSALNLLQAHAYIQYTCIFNINNGMSFSPSPEYITTQTQKL